MDERVLALARDFRKAIEPLYGDRLKELRVYEEPANPADPDDIPGAQLIIVIDPLTSEYAEFVRVSVRLRPLIEQYGIDALPFTYSAAHWARERTRLEACSMPIAA